MADVDARDLENLGELGMEPGKAGGGVAGPGVAQRDHDGIGNRLGHEYTLGQLAMLVEIGLVTPSLEKAWNVTLPWPNWRWAPCTWQEATTALASV